MMDTSEVQDSYVDKFLPNFTEDEFALGEAAAELEDVSVLGDISDALDGIAPTAVENDAVKLFDQFLDEFTDSDEAGNVASVQMTPDILLESLGNFAESADTGSALDDAAFRKLKEMLQEDGFDVSWIDDYEILEEVKGYAERCRALVSNDYADFTKQIEDSYLKTVEDLSASKATFRAHESYLNEFRANVANSTDKELAAIQLVVINLVNESVECLAREHSLSDLTVDMVNASEIMNRLFHTGSVNSMQVNLHMDDVVSYVNTVIPIIVNNYKSDASSYARDRDRRRTMAEMLLRPESDVVKWLCSAGTVLQPIKQVERGYDNRLFIKCSKCGQLHELRESPVMFVYFPAETGYSRSFSPVIERCKCGEAFILPPEDCLRIEYKYVTSYKTELKNAILQSSNLSTGAAFIRIVPPLGMFESEMSFLVRDTDAVFDESTAAGRVVEESTSLNINMSDFKQAVANFYCRLDGFCKKAGIDVSIGTEQSVVEDDSSDICSLDSTRMPSYRSNNIQYSELAYYVAQCIGVNYDELKMRAFCSLVSFISENAALEYALNDTELQSLKDKYTVIVNNDYDFQLLDKGAFLDLVDLCFTLYKGEEHVVETVDLEDREQLHVLLRAKIESLRDMINKIEAKRNEVLTDLEGSRVSLSYCKIINYQSYQLADIVSYVSNKRIFDLLNDVSDRMIINNYADSFFNHWRTLNVVRKSDLTSALTKSSSPEKVATKIKRLLNDRLNMNHFDANVAKWFGACLAMSSIKQEPLHKLVATVRNNNYYKFCKEVMNFYLVEDTHMGEGYTIALYDAISACRELAASVVQKKEYEFYLSDFSQEELDENAELFSTLIFSRYVLKRRNGETAEEYVARYNKGMPESRHGMSEYYDNAHYFREIPHLTYILSSSMLYDIGYQDYMSSTFMSSLMHVLAYVGNRDYACKVLGLADTHLNVIIARKHSWTYDDVCFIDNAAVLRVLNGYYFTSIRDLVYDLRQRFESILFKPSIGVQNFKKCFCFDDELNAVFRAASIAIHSDPDAVDDIEQARNEVSMFAADEQFVSALHLEVD